MRLTSHLGIGIAAVLTSLVAPYLTSAETKLTDFNGVWRGSGTDRNSVDKMLKRRFEPNYVA
jgi:hypothetical protein